MDSWQASAEKVPLCLFGPGVGYQVALLPAGDSAPADKVLEPTAAIRGTRSCPGGSGRQHGRLRSQAARCNPVEQDAGDDEAVKQCAGEHDPAERDVTVRLAARLAARRARDEPVDHRHLAVVPDGSESRPRRRRLARLWAARTMLTDRLAAWRRARLLRGNLLACDYAVKECFGFARESAGRAARVLGVG